MSAVDDFCGFYHDYHDITPARRRAQGRALAEFTDDVGDPLTCDAATLQAHLGRLVDGGLSPNTVRWRLGMLRPFFTWAWQQKLIDGDRLMELREVRPPRGATRQGKPKPYRPKDVRRLWDELADAYPWTWDHGDEDRGAMFLGRWQDGRSKWSRAQPYAKRCQAECITLLALHGGIRRDEIYRLTLEDLDDVAEYVVVTSARKNPQGEARVRVVPWMTQELRDAVARWLRVRAAIAPDHDSMWLSLHQAAHFRKPLRFRQFEMLMRNIGHGWEFHRLRHTMATQALRSGVDIYVLQRILGHTRISQTLEYAQIDEDDVMRAANRSRAGFTDAMSGKAAA